MHILEHTPTRLVLYRRRGGMALLMSVFTLVSAFWVVHLTLQGVTRFFATPDLGQILAWLMWLMVGIILTALGAISLASAVIGIRLSFDKTTGNFTLQKAGYLRPLKYEYSLYALLRLDVERNNEVRVWGVFMVLRSGERLPLTTFPLHDEAAVQAFTQLLRNFLWR
jgi:hypothetical protein